MMVNVVDAESEKRQKEWIQVALLELEDYQRHREELLGKTKKSNRWVSKKIIGNGLVPSLGVMCKSEYLYCTFILHISRVH